MLELGILETKCTNHKMLADRIVAMLRENL